MRQHAFYGAIRKKPAPDCCVFMGTCPANVQSIVPAPHDHACSVLAWQLQYTVNGHCPTSTDTQFCSAVANTRLSQCLHTADQSWQLTGLIVIIKIREKTPKPWMAPYTQALANGAGAIYLHLPTANCQLPTIIYTDHLSALFLTSDSVKKI